MTAEARYLALIDEIRDEFPRFRVIKKSDSPLHRTIHIALMVVTAGGMRSYLNGYQTTLGQRVYVTDDWEMRDPDLRTITMRHERVHLRQFRRYTFAGMAIAYLLLPLPLGLAYCRARLEWQAYAETIRATAEIRGESEILQPSFQQGIVDQFTGPAYGWMWPFRRQVQSWVMAAVDTARAELRIRGGR